MCMGGMGDEGTKRPPQADLGKHICSVLSLWQEVRVGVSSNWLTLICGRQRVAVLTALHQPGLSQSFASGHTIQTTRDENLLTFCVGILDEKSPFAILSVVPYLLRNSPL